MSLRTTGSNSYLEAPLIASLRILRGKLASITPNVCIVRWVPEQGEDLYDVLVDGVTVAHVEIPRRAFDQEPVFVTWSVEEYLRASKAFTKPERRKLELAVQLARCLNEAQD